VAWPHGFGGRMSPLSPYSRSCRFTSDRPYRVSSVAARGVRLAQDSIRPPRSEAGARRGITLNAVPMGRWRKLGASAVTSGYGSQCQPRPLCTGPWTVLDDRQNVRMRHCVLIGTSRSACRLSTQGTALPTRFRPIVVSIAVPIVGTITLPCQPVPGHN
jgi:hypothetical protein